MPTRLARFSRLSFARAEPPGASLRARWLGAALLAAACPAGAAGYDEVQALAEMPLDSLLNVEVSGASKFSQPLRSAPSSATVITAAEIHALGHRTLADVLRTVRGLNINSDRSYSYLGVRGIAAPGDYNTRVLLLIDGNRINDGVFDQAFLGSEFPVDLELVERVEFIPGPGSAVHGANALFGVVNVVTRRSPEGRHGSASVSVGSSGLRSGSAVVRAGGLDQPSLMLSASRTIASGRSLYFPQYAVPEQSDGVSRGTDGEQQNRVYLRFDNAAGLSATLIHADRTKGASATGGVVFGDPRNTVRDVQTQASLQWSGRVQADTELTARAYLNRYRFVGDYVVDVPPQILNRDTVEARDYGLEVRAVSTRWRDHKLVVGAELQKSPRRDQANFDLEPYASYLDDRRTGHRVSLFAEDQYQLASDLTLSLGGRFDRTENGDGEFSPRLGAVWQPDAQWAVKYLYGSAYRQPNAYERFYAYPGEGGYKGNPGLGNERVRGHELALEYRPEPTLKFAASIYRNQVDRLIVQRQDPADGLLVFGNEPTLSTRGVELEAEATLPWRARLRANVSFQRDSDAAVFGAQVARRLGNLTLLVPLPSSWTLGLSAGAVGRRALAPGHAVTDLTLSNDAPWRRWRVAFSVYNVANRRLSDPSTDAFLPGTVPQDRRGARVKLDLRF
ncbi:MAG: TonB-dependent receptor [Comamonadaceae bacterium]|nr:MAG: TonB-dependent receptor [Comamonadaceae bacterium]